MVEAIEASTLEIYLSYDGLQASSHRMDMRRLGYAMVGLDHIITVGVVGLLERRQARSRERLLFDVVATEPRKGTVGILGELMTAYTATQGMLPYAVSVMKDKAPDFVWYWVSFVFKKLGGREKEANILLDKVIDSFANIHKDTLIDRQSERAFILQLVDRLKPSAAQVAVPIGESADILRIAQSPDAENFQEIGVPEAAAIRAKEPLDVGDPKVMKVRIDGLIKHTNRGSVELADESGRFVNAEIRDVLFEVTPNPYIAAMNSDELIEVTVVPTYKAGELFKLYVMGIPGNDDASRNTKAG